MIVEPKVTIIGGGLSAIYAYWGAQDAGYTPSEIQVLYDTRVQPAGAVFMYECPIPWPKRNVTSILLGTADEYSMNQWDVIKPTSAHVRFAEHPAVTEKLYLTEEVLTTLWGMIPRKAESPTFTPEDIERMKGKRDAVICTFPNPKKRQEYKSRGFLTGFPIHIGTAEGHDCVVIYNGLKTVPWVRQTTKPGYIYTEYADVTNHDSIMRYESERGNVQGTIRYAPDLHPDTIPLEWDERKEGNLFRVGRYSAFQPGYLSHTARKETEKFLCDL